MRKWIALLAMACSVVLIASANAGSVQFSDFSSVNGLKLNGEAKKAGDALRLVDAKSQAGSAFTKDRVVNTEKSFSSRFVIRPGAAKAGPGDGMAFVIHSGDASALGQGGGGLGYSGITHSLAIEFDLFFNSEFNDLDGNHVGITQEGDPAAPLDQGTPNFDMFDTKVFAWVKYKAETGEMSVRVADKNKKPKKPIVKAPVFLNAVVSARKARAGFTAGTGSNVIRADVLRWTLK